MSSLPLQPKNAKAFYRLGMGYSACNQPADAAGALLHALQIDPFNGAIAEALRTELLCDSLKGMDMHVDLVQQCTVALERQRKPLSSGDRTHSRHSVQWQMVQLQGEKPAARGGATLSCVGGRLWLMGGADRHGHVYGDLWEFEPSRGWHQHRSLHSCDQSFESEFSALFGARSGHAAGTFEPDGTDGGALLIAFGGQDPNSSKLFSAACCIRVHARDDPDAQHESRLSRCKSPCWMSVRSDGLTPCARTGHSLSIDEKRRCGLLFGGANEDAPLADLYQLRLLPAAESAVDSSTLFEWTSPECTGVPPSAREMHVAIIEQHQRLLLVHGGRSAEAILTDVQVLSLDTWTWNCAGDTPHRRVGHTLVSLAPHLSLDNPASTIMCFGGFSGDSFVQETATLFPAVLRAGSTPNGWISLSSSAAPSGRFAHAATGFRDSLYVFGGSEPSGELDDLWLAKFDEKQ